MLDGLDRHKAPLSEHLHTVTSTWTADALAARDHTRNFEMLEVLTSLAFLTVVGTKEEFEKVRANDPTRDQNFLWSPVSRVSFENENRDLILAELKRPEFRAPMLKAGFSGKDEAHFDLAIESLETYGADSMVILSGSGSLTWPDRNMQLDTTPMYGSGALGSICIARSTRPAPRSTSC
jgi:hypothetical protein